MLSRENSLFMEKNKMNIFNYLQVNSHFVYSEDFNIDFAKDLYACKLKLRKFKDNTFCDFLENAIFGKETVYVHIKTNQGQFILTNVANEIEDKKVQEYITLNSQKSPTYYFSNVDYFLYGRFGYAEEGKIVRYLSYNSEAAEGDEVAWIGKPHNWEYESHTFFSKQKLENGEMDFGSNEVCEMVEFYLPFIHNDLNILECEIYGTDKQYINSFVKPKKINKEKLKKLDLANSYERFKQYDVNTIRLLIYANSFNIIIDNHFLGALKYTDINDLIFLSCDKKYIVNHRVGLESKVDFYNKLTKSLIEAANATEKGCADLVDELTKVNQLNPYYLVFKFIKPTKFEIHLIDENANKQIYFGTKLSQKISNEIFDIILKWNEKKCNK